MKRKLKTLKKTKKKKIKRLKFPKTKITTKLNKALNKRGIWILKIDKLNNWDFEYYALSKDGRFIDSPNGDYIIDENNILMNKKHGALGVFYDQNPNQCQFNWKHATIGKGDIIVTSDSLKKYMLQKIWGDFVGNPFVLNMKTMLILGACAMGGLIFFYFVRGG